MSWGKPKKGGMIMPRNDYVVLTPALPWPASLAMVSLCVPSVCVSRTCKLTVHCLLYSGIQPCWLRRVWNECAVLYEAHMMVQPSFRIVYLVSVCLEHVN
jgi:hypothetical protein